MKAGCKSNHVLLSITIIPKKSRRARLTQDSRKGTEKNGADDEEDDDVWNHSQAGKEGRRRWQKENQGSHLLSLPLSLSLSIFQASFWSTLNFEVMSHEQRKKKNLKGRRYSGCRFKYEKEFLFSFTSCLSSLSFHEQKREDEGKGNLNWLCLPFNFISLLSFFFPLFFSLSPLYFSCCRLLYLSGRHWKRQVKRKLPKTAISTSCCEGTSRGTDAAEHVTSSFLSLSLPHHYHLHPVPSAFSQVKMPNTCVIIEEIFFFLKRMKIHVHRLRLKLTHMQ